MDEMNEHELARDIDRQVSNKTGLIALSICLGVAAVIVLAGAVVLIQQMA